MKSPSSTTYENKTTIDYRTLNKHRVVDFEDELATKVKSFSSLEQELLKIASDRKEWLANMSQTDNFDYELFSKRTLLYRTQAELYAVQMEREITNVEKCYEEQTLMYLVEVTRPFDFTSKDEIVERERYVVPAVCLITFNFDVYVTL
jgi:uncharacterized damage-inducible protein DinB